VNIIKLQKIYRKHKEYVEAQMRENQREISVYQWRLQVGFSGQLAFLDSIFPSYWKGFSIYTSHVFG